MTRSLERGSLAALAGLAPHYLSFYLGLNPLWTDTIAEWIMARTPSRYALWVLDHLGSAAKPFALTGALATLGAGVFCIGLFGRRWRFIPALLIALLYGYAFDYVSIIGQLTFWMPALLVLEVAFATTPSKTAAIAINRRQALTMAAGTIWVAAEAFWREKRLAGHTTPAADFKGFAPPPDTFAPNLVRKAITPADAFYAMSKNTVDPELTARDWLLRITYDGGPIKSLTYRDLLDFPLSSEYVTLRCISNTLQSDLMGTAYWTGVRLNQLLTPVEVPADVVEMAVTGVDGHGDSFAVPYLLSGDVLLAVAMNGRTLSRLHGYPARLVVPKYYGFKNIKWVTEIALRREPYFGTWPKLGYTKEPVVHTASHIDKMTPAGRTISVGGVSFAGDRGIRRVRVRGTNGAWLDATLEQPISRFTWTRWRAEIDSNGVTSVEAQAQDGDGRWQEQSETSIFPNGVAGPTIRRLG